MFRANPLADDLQQLRLGFQRRLFPLPKLTHIRHDAVVETTTYAPLNRDIRQNRSVFMRRDVLLIVRRFAYGAARLRNRTL
jgi:hypothetical protein